MITSINETDFEKQVLQASSPVLVDFYADWCGPCKMAEPILEELSQAHEGKITFLKVNVDQAASLSQKYGVMSIPTTILFNKGQELGRSVGFSGKEGFETLLQKAG